jgi:hypothetical protein
MTHRHATRSWHGVHEATAGDSAWHRGAAATSRDMRWVSAVAALALRDDSAAAAMLQCPCSQAGHSGSKYLSSPSAAQQQADGGFARLGRPPAHPSSATAPPRASLVHASAAGQAGTGIARHELALAAYLTARLIVGRPVDPEDIARLRKANDSVDETRQRLPLGRGNVIEDIDATDGDSMWRANAARSYAYHLDRRHHVPDSDLPKQTLHQAVAATAFSAGRCGEYSPTAAVLHTSRLQPGESLHIVSDSGHQWAEARIGGDRDRAVVLDAWASGPPVLAPDGSHTARPTNNTLGSPGSVGWRVRTMRSACTAAARRAKRPRLSAPRPAPTPATSA